MRSVKWLRLFQMGKVLTKFGCSKHLEFPNGVVVNDRQEIFISDNRAHCVKVFNYEGVYLRQIGGEGEILYLFWQRDRQKFQSILEILGILSCVTKKSSYLYRCLTRVE